METEEAIEDTETIEVTNRKTKREEKTMMEKTPESLQEDEEIELQVKSARRSLAQRLYQN